MPIGKSSAPGVPRRQRRPHPQKYVRGPYGAASGLGMSLQEIADQLQCSHQAVAQLLRSATRKLQRYHPEALSRLRTLADELALARQARLRGLVCVPHVQIPS